MAVDLTVVLDVHLWVLLDAGQFRVAFVEPPPGPSQFPWVTSGIFWCIHKPRPASYHGLSLYSDKGSSSMEQPLAGWKKKKIKQLNTREGIMLSSSVEEQEVKVMMRSGQEPTLLV